MFTSILLVGCGKMGGALLARWRAARIGGRIYVIEEQEATRKQLDVAAYATLDELPREVTADCVLFAVKPQSLGEILPAYRERFGAAPCYVSIAAGKTLAFFESALGAAAMVRAMPNTPALIGEGMTALVANGRVNMQQKKNAEALFDAAGEVAWLPDESLMDAVTAISGSGPAYVFYFLECLVAAGVEAGLDAALARALAVQTVRGAAGLAGQSELPLEALRKMVTSPGGTTEAALAVLMDTRRGVEATMRKAVEDAIARAGELAE